MPGSFRSRQKKLAYIVLCTNNFFLKTLKTLNITVKLILIKQELFNLQNDDKLSNFSKLQHIILLLNVLIIIKTTF